MIDPIPATILKRVRADRKIWIIPAMVIVLLLPVGLTIWLMIAVTVHYHGVDQSTVAFGGAVYTSIAIVFYLMLRLFRRRSLRVWQRCFLALVGAVLTIVGMINLGGFGWYAMAFYSLGAFMLMALIQEQIILGTGDNYG